MTVFHYNLFIHMYQSLQMGASARNCFPIQFTNSFLPLLGAFLYNPIAETTELKAVTSNHQALTVQGVDYRHIYKYKQTLWC